MVTTAFAWDIYAGVTTWMEISDMLDVRLNLGLLIAGYLINIAFFLSYAYAHVSFVLEVKRGIMSKETYKSREEASCCCV